MIVVVAVVVIAVGRGGAGVEEPAQVANVGRHPRVERVRIELTELERFAAGRAEGLMARRHAEAVAAESVATVQHARVRREGLANRADEMQLDLAQNNRELYADEAVGELVHFALCRSSRGDCGSGAGAVPAVPRGRLRWGPHRCGWRVSHLI
jgi:hypothetical protein